MMMMSTRLLLFHYQVLCIYAREKSMHACLLWNGWKKEEIYVWWRWSDRHPPSPLLLRFIPFFFARSQFTHRLLQTTTTHNNCLRRFYYKLTTTRSHLNKSILLFIGYIHNIQRATACVAKKVTLVAAVVNALLTKTIYTESIASHIL